jgi:ABC-type oligopeptide transport system ATPase subunit
MYQGEIVERGDTASLFADPQHDYTKRLLGAVPTPDPRSRKPRTSNARAPGPSQTTTSGVTSLASEAVVTEGQSTGSDIVFRVDHDQPSARGVASSTGNAERN